VSAQSKSGADAEGNHVLTLDVTSPAALTSGTLAIVTFVATDGAHPGTDLRILNIKRTARTAGGATLETRGAEGVITLAEPPAPCFFYMH
jgi:hypothetical protein